MSRPEFNSRTADKFVVRMPDGMRDQIEQLAAERHTSMNSEIIQAIESHLAGQARQKLLLDALEARLTLQTAEAPLPITVPADDDYLDGLKTAIR